jgi:hypothetical protein
MALVKYWHKEKNNKVVFHGKVCTGKTDTAGIN